MDILDLLKDRSTDLPILQKHSEDFMNLVKRTLYEYMELIFNANNKSFKIGEKRISTIKYKNQIEKLCLGLIDTLYIYYEGSPSRAFKRLDETLTQSGIRSFLDKDLFFEPGKNFYRIRKATGNYPLSKQEIFHIPFESRGKVKTQRFSIPGLPSLYLSNSVYVAWEEMRRPNIDSIQAVRLVNDMQINLLDLTTDAYNNTYQFAQLSNMDKLYKVLTWPLVACCSIKVRDVEDSFKPEYIIPQLLLQWINKEKLHGIKYSSTHIDTNSQYIEGLFYNIVLPVKSCFPKGYCRELSSIFTMTQVLPMQLRQFASNSDKFNNMISISTNVNPDITSIELIKGTSQPYSMTSFGILEHSLNSLEVSQLHK